MKHIMEQKVYYSDTDAYAVTWHGSYLRWLEAARVEFCEHFGKTLVELEDMDIVLPVTNLNVRYKSSAKLNDKVIIETSVKKYTPLYVVFEQKVMNKETGKINIEAEVTVVAVNKQGKLYRKMPQILTDMFKKACDEE